MGALQALWLGSPRLSNHPRGPVTSTLSPSPHQPSSTPPLLALEGGGETEAPEFGLPGRQRSTPTTQAQQPQPVLYLGGHNCRRDLVGSIGSRLQPTQDCKGYWHLPGCSEPQQDNLTLALGSLVQGGSHRAKHSQRGPAGANAGYPAPCLPESEVKQGRPDELTWEASFLSSLPFTLLGTKYSPTSQRAPSPFLSPPI